MDVNKTLPLALLGFRDQYLTDYPLFFSDVIVTAIQMLDVHAFLQRYFIQGITTGFVKGQYPNLPSVDEKRRRGLGQATSSTGQLPPGPDLRRPRAQKIPSRR